MSKVEFVNQPQGGNRKIFLLRRPRHTTKTLLPLIEQLTELGVLSDPRKKTKLRSTWFHLGRPEGLLRQITNVNLELNEGDFTAALENLLLDISAMKWGSVPAYGEKLVPYGYPPRSFAGFKLQITPELMEGRERVLERVKGFLHDCGIPAAADFMAHNANLKHTLTDKFDPHISLGIRNPDVPLPNLDISGIKLTLQPPQLVGVRIIQ